MSRAALFASSRGRAPTVSFSAAVSAGLASDGGLYVPLDWPQLAAQDFAPVSTELPAVAAQLLAPFLAADPLAASLPAIATEAFSFKAPPVPLAGAERLSVLELFHGPTAA